jgi:lipopolysaccharide transport system ATP-binding protein
MLSPPLSLKCERVSRSFIIEDRITAWRILMRPTHGRKFQALSNVTIQVPKGQFVGVLGRNGAGKSTLLRTIGGVYAPDSGVVVVNGDMSALYELGLTGNEHLTGAGFARRWFEVFGTSGKKRKLLISEVADFSELGDAFERPIRSYSAGMKARLYFALATARQSEVYVIDEVLSVGDEYFQNKCWRRLRQRLSNGASGIIATHDWSAILRLCPQSFIIDKGVSVANGPSPGIVRQYLGLSTENFGTGAKFFPEPPAVIHANALEDFTLELGVQATEKLDLSMSAAVEVFVPGFGWEHVLHSDPQPIGVGPGDFVAQLRIPQLPLKKGEYSLAIFISANGEDGRRVLLDVRSWTYGEGLSLIVDGADSIGAIRSRLRAYDQQLELAAQ